MITRSIKMALKKIHEACEKRRNCDGCPYSVTGGCFFIDEEAEGRRPEEWGFDMLKGEDK